jgi:hypothetical protein
MTALEAQDQIAVWLTSEVRPGNAMDAPFYLRKAALYERLAQEVDDEELARRLAEVADRAQARAKELGGPPPGAVEPQPHRSDDQ